jgi:hypothetical protein
LTFSADFEQTSGGGTTEYLARIEGSNLMSHILRSLEQAIVGKAIPGGHQYFGHCGNTKFVVAAAGKRFGFPALA